MTSQKRGRERKPEERGRRRRKRTRRKDGKMEEVRERTRGKWPQG